MTREEIQQKYASLHKEWVNNKGYCSRELAVEFGKLRDACSHPYGCFNGEIGGWRCPDCGHQK